MALGNEDDSVHTQARITRLFDDLGKAMTLCDHIFHDERSVIVQNGIDATRD